MHCRRSPNSPRRSRHTGAAAVPGAASAADRLHLCVVQSGYGALRPDGALSAAGGHSVAWGTLHAGSAGFRHHQRAGVGRVPGRFHRAHHGAAHPCPDSPHSARVLSGCRRHLDCGRLCARDPFPVPADSRGTVGARPPCARPARLAPLVHAASGRRHGARLSTRRGDDSPRLWHAWSRGDGWRRSPAGIFRDLQPLAVGTGAGRVADRPAVYA